MNIKASKGTGFVTALALAGAAVVMLTISCGGSSSTQAPASSTAPTSPTPTTTPTAPVPSVTPQIAGSWAVDWSSDGWMGLKAKVDLTQSGDTVTGTWADTVAINWKGTISGTFISPSELTATVTFTSHGRGNLPDTCTGTGTFIWNWDTRYGTNPMLWAGGFNWTGGTCTCTAPCVSYPAKARWYMWRSN